jgi:hypothetical protein
LGNKKPAPGTGAGLKRAYLPAAEDTPIAGGVNMVSFLLTVGRAFRRIYFRSFVVLKTLNAAVS